MPIAHIMPRALISVKPSNFVSRQVYKCNCSTMFKCRLVKQQSKFHSLVGRRAQENAAKTQKAA